MISFYFENIEPLEFNQKKIRQWIKRTASVYGKNTGDISYVFCTDERILEVNRQYLQHDYYTDIITFDYSMENIIAGDIFISIDTVRSNAEKYGEDKEKELYRVIIHGILHLCGQNDKTPGEQAEMTRKEDMALKEIFNK